MLTPTPTPLPLATLSATAIPAAILQALEQEMVEAVNQERLAAGLTPYRVDGKLASAARAHARDMATRDYLSHVTPEGKTLEERLQEWDLQATWTGENIVSTPGPTSQAVATGIELLMNDPPHRDLILHERFTRIGVGVAEGQPGWYIFVLDLASN